MRRFALALAALSADAFLLSGCVLIERDRGGGHYRGGPYRRW
jgi:hypothetical protein